MPDFTRIRRDTDLIREGLRPTGEAGPAWRRGIMHAVESVDLVLAQKMSPREQLAAIRQRLDELAEFQRTQMPATHAEAFELCKADLERAQRKPGEAA